VRDDEPKQAKVLCTGRVGRPGDLASGSGLVVRLPWRLMATSGPDLLVAAYRVLSEDEQDEAFSRLHEARVTKEAATDSDMARYLRSLQIVAEAVGRTPTSDDYRAAQPKLAAAGEPVESFSRLYRFFGSWPRAREALDLSTTARNTPRRIEARFRERRLGKIWRYDDDDLRDTLARAVEHVGYPPSTTEFDWWREREFELARATGHESPHLPSVTPYRKRWGTWEEALLHFGYSEEDVVRRLTSKKNIITRDWNPDAMLPPGLPMASLRDGKDDGGPLGSGQLVKLREAYSGLPRRLRYVLTVRLGLGVQAMSLKRAGTPLALSISRIQQIQLQTVELLVDAVATGADDARGPLRAAIETALARLAVPSITWVRSALFSR
jgi:Homing endonuclease associated repeat